MNEDTIFGEPWPFEDTPEAKKETKEEVKEEPKEEPLGDWEWF